VYSTSSIGGDAIALDASNNAYVTGTTSSTDFPTTPGAFQTAYGGGDYFGDAFVTKLSADGSALVYSTYLGGSSDDRGSGIAVDALGDAYVTGDTSCVPWLTCTFITPTPGAFQTTYAGGGDAFVAKLNTVGSALIYFTYLGGSGSDAGTYSEADAFVAVDASGNAYVTGRTGSSDFPTTSDAFQIIYGGNGDAFVTKLNAAGSALLYSTYLGGSSSDEAFAVAIDGSGNAYVTGATGTSTYPPPPTNNFPVTAGAIQTTFAGGFDDAFVAKMSIPDLPVLVLSPSRLTFARVPIGTTGTAEKVRLSNGGTKTLSLTSIIASGDFAQTNDAKAQSRRQASAHSA
jgi:hypothetical protein